MKTNTVYVKMVSVTALSGPVVILSFQLWVPGVCEADSAQQLSESTRGQREKGSRAREALCWSL